MRRTPLKRTRFPRKRPDAAKVKAWRAIKAALWQRAEGHCEVPWCKEAAQDPHHVIKRSQGGPDTLDNLVALCRRHHDATDLPQTPRHPWLRIVRRWDGREATFMFLHREVLRGT